ncbi:MAG TPA: hypothetical protein VIY47_05400 [Ignavibacteriaceae bacterium]
MKKSLILIALICAGSAHAEIASLKQGPDVMMKEYRKEIQANQSQLTQPLGNDTWQYAQMMIPTLMKTQKPTTIQELVTALAKTQAPSYGPNGYAPNGAGMTTGGVVGQGMATPGGAQQQIAPVQNNFK